MISGQEVCPELSLVFECIGTDVNLLKFQRNGVEIRPSAGNFHIGDTPGESRNADPYTLVLEAIDVHQPNDRIANITVRLMVNISSLVSGDEITCATLGGKNSSITLNYMLRGIINYYTSYYTLNECGNMV